MQFFVFMFAEMANDIKESVAELKCKLETMKQLLAENGALGAVPQRDPTGHEPFFRHSPSSSSASQDYLTNRRYYSRREASLIDGNFLSAIFGVIFLLIVGVSFYAFQNLYFAILKKFPSKHTEL